MNDLFLSGFFFKLDLDIEVCHGHACNGYSFEGGGDILLINIIADSSIVSHCVHLSSAKHTASRKIKKKYLKQNKDTCVCVEHRRNAINN